MQTEMEESRVVCRRENSVHHAGVVSAIRTTTRLVRVNSDRNHSTIDEYRICCGCSTRCVRRVGMRFRVPLGGKCRSGVDDVTVS
jgi:hypothetical protein